MQSELKFIDGGVTAPEGFTANGILCKIKESRKIIARCMTELRKREIAENGR